MQEIIICFGPMGAGKTAYAKKLAKGIGYEYLCFDDAFGMSGWKPEPFLNYIITKINEEKINAVMDGWFAWDEKQIKSVEKIEKELRVKWVHLFAPKWILEDRIASKESDVRESLDLSIERTSTDKVNYNCKLIDTTDFEYEGCSKEEYQKRMGGEVTKSNVKKLLQEIRGQENYQNIQLPFGLSTNGYRDCEDSWAQIKPLIDWKGKTVLDVGAYWGYFCFEIKQEGAKEVVGTDTRDDALGTARMIRKLKRINVVFKKHDIEFGGIDREYDVILLLNTLHHLRSPFHVLRKMFAKAKNVILEVELPHNKYLRVNPAVEMGDPIKLSGGKIGGHLRFSKPMLMRFASENGHFLKKEVESFRPDRTILMFQRD